MNCLRGCVALNAEYGGLVDHRGILRLRGACNPRIVSLSHFRLVSTPLSLYWDGMNTHVSKGLFCAPKLRLLDAAYVRGSLPRSLSSCTCPLLCLFIHGVH